MKHTWRAPLHIFWAREAGRPERPIPEQVRLIWLYIRQKVSPMPTPRGLAKLNIAQDRTKAFTFDNNLSNNSLIIFCQTILSLIFKILTERLLWAMLSPRLNAMMALCIITCSSSCSFLSQIVNLCIITAKKSVTMSPLLSWRPIASPCKNRLEQKYRLDKSKFFFL